jgi:hypothetical protein
MTVALPMVMQGATENDRARTRGVDEGRLHDAHHVTRIHRLNAWD